MDKIKDNIIHFQNPHKNWEEVDGEVTVLAKKTLFKNAGLIDIENSTCNFVDFLVENKKITTISEVGGIAKDKQTEVVDLHNNFVLPAFFNAFETLDVLNSSFQSLNKKGKNFFAYLMGMKDILSGVVNFQNDVGEILLEKVSKLEEKDLSEISNMAAKQNRRVWLKIGQDLEELGAVDKKFGKGIVQVLEDFGILDREWVLVGGNCLEKDDLRLLRQYGDRVVICPSEDGQVGRRPTNLKTLFDLDFSVRIGSGRAFEIDFFAFMRQILMTQWALFEDKSWLSEKDVLLMCTNDTPCLEEGSSADFVVLDGSISLYPTILQNLVWGKSKKDVVMTVADGRVLHENGDIETGNGELSYSDLVNLILINKKEKNNDN